MGRVLTVLLATMIHSAAWAAAPASQPADDDSGDVRENCVYCRGERSLDDDEDMGEEEEGPRHHHRWGRHRFDKGVVKGFGITVLGGADLRARPDLDKYGEQLGPAGDPARMSGIFEAQAWVMFTPYLRLGGDFTYTNFNASGSGPDAGGLNVRQSVGYEETSGGFLAEAVWPVNKQIELSLGAEIGGGHLHVSSLATRIDDFNSLGVDLRAVPKVEAFNLDAGFLDVKSALGLKVKATAHVAVDFRVGLKTVYVSRGALGFSGSLPLTGSPEIVELQPFVTVGASFGAWQF